MRFTWILYMSRRFPISLNCLHFYTVVSVPITPVSSLCSNSKQFFTLCLNCKQKFVLSLWDYCAKLFCVNQRNFVRNFIFYYFITIYLTTINQARWESEIFVVKIFVQGWGFWGVKVDWFFCNILWRNLYISVMTTFSRSFNRHYSYFDWLKFHSKSFHCQIFVFHHLQKLKQQYKFKVEPVYLVTKKPEID